MDTRLCYLCDGEGADSGLVLGQSGRRHLGLQLHVSCAIRAARLAAVGGHPCGWILEGLDAVVDATGPLSLPDALAALDRAAAIDAAEELLRGWNAP
jgi:hypothetical protein